jgi:hypothetical protein
MAQKSWRRTSSEPTKTRWGVQPKCLLGHSVGRGMSVRRARLSSQPRTPPVTVPADRTARITAHQHIPSANPANATPPRIALLLGYGRPALLAVAGWAPLSRCSED